MMESILLLLAVVLNIAALVLLFIIYRKFGGIGMEQTKALFGGVEKDLSRLEVAFREEIARSRQENSLANQQNREETSKTLSKFNETLIALINNINGLQQNQLESFSKQIANLTQNNEAKLEKMRETIEAKLKLIQDDNNIKLEAMRMTVDEKLNSTLEQRLGESFKLVSERLEQVHKGLGEMQTLASGVGDLKKVLTNVKARGTWGEVQLEALLEQTLTTDQYLKNVNTNRVYSGDTVEFAIKMPGRDADKDFVLLPIDAKFPMEDYQKLVDAQELGNLEEVKRWSKALEDRIKSQAKDIKTKYINPPETVDFGILFLPVEGLYAEVLRKPGLFEHIRRVCKVIITGPTTLTAILSSLQMGFRTLAVEKRSSEVWTVLGAVKAEFGKFGDILEKTQKKLQEASNIVDTAASKTRNIQRKLKKVEALPLSESEPLLMNGNEDTDDEE